MPIHLYNLINNIYSNTQESVIISNQPLVDYYSIIKTETRSMNDFRGSIICTLAQSRIAYPFGKELDVIKVIDIDDDKFERQLKGHTTPIQALAALGNDLLVAVDRNNVRIWDVENDKCIKIFANQVSNIIMPIMPLNKTQFIINSSEGSHLCDINQDNFVKVADEPGSLILDANHMASLVKDPKAETLGLIKITNVYTKEYVCKALSNRPSAPPIPIINMIRVLPRVCWYNYNQADRVVLLTDELIAYWDNQTNRIRIQSKVDDFIVRYLPMHDMGGVNQILTLSDGRLVVLGAGTQGGNQFRIITGNERPIDNKDIEKVLDALTDNQSVLTLSLAGLALGNQQVKQLAAILNVNQTIKHLNLNNCKISDQGARLLLQALKVNRQISSIDLEDNPISKHLLSLIDAELYPRARRQKQPLPLAAQQASQFDETINSQETVVITKEFVCPITGLIMLEPVLAADGETYEREAIEAWLAANDKSPITSEPLSHKHLIPNLSIKRMIAGFIAAHTELKQSQKIYFSKALQIPLIEAVQQQDSKRLIQLLEQDERLITHKLEDKLLLEMAIEKGDLGIYQTVLQQLKNKLKHQFELIGGLAVLPTIAKRFGIEGYQVLIQTLGKDTMAYYALQQGVCTFFDSIALAFGEQGVFSTLTVLAEPLTAYLSEDEEGLLFSSITQKYGLTGAEAVAKHLQWEPNYYDHMLQGILPDIVKQQSAIIKNLSAELRSDKLNNNNRSEPQLAANLMFFKNDAGDNIKAEPTYSEIINTSRT